MNVATKQLLQELLLYIFTFNQNVVVIILEVRVCKRGVSWKR